MDPLTVTLVVIGVMLFAVLAGLWSRRFRRELHFVAQVFGSTEEARLYRLSTPWNGSRTVGVREEWSTYVVFNPWTGEEFATVPHALADSPDDAMYLLGYDIKGA